MTLQKKYLCSFHSGIIPEYAENPNLCSWCRGTLEWEGDVYFHDYKGKFRSIDYETIGISNGDFIVYVDCVCGEEIFLGEAGDVKACNCGRVFRMSVSIEVDEDHIGEIDWLLEESNRGEKEMYKKYGIEK